MRELIKRLLDHAAFKDVRVGIGYPMFGNPKFTARGIDCPHCEVAVKAAMSEIAAATVGTLESPYRGGVEIYLDDAAHLTVEILGANRNIWQRIEANYSFETIESVDLAYAFEAAFTELFAYVKALEVEQVKRLTIDMP